MTSKWIFNVPHGPIHALIQETDKRTPEFFSGRWGLRVWTKQGPVFIGQLLVNQNLGGLHALFGFDERSGKAGEPSMFFLANTDVLTAQLINLEEIATDGDTTPA